MDEPITKDRRVIEDATCLGCACFCDDLTLIVEDGKLIEARRACEDGRRWYDSAQGAEEMAPLIGRKSVDLAEAIGRAADILAGARSPIVLGLGEATIEAQRAAMAIADRIGATLPTESTWSRAFQRLGSVGATLGEVRDRADLIVFDGGRSGSMPRFWERYVEQPGRFVPGGRSGRTIIWLGEYPPEPSPDRVDHPDLIVPMARSTGYPILRALLAGVSLDDRAVRCATGASIETLTELVERFKQARYGVFLLDQSLPTRAIEPVMALVRDLNRWTRFVALRPPVDKHLSAPSMVAAWQSGFEEGVDFSLGFPRHVPADGAFERLERDEVDAILHLGDHDTLRLIRATFNDTGKARGVVIGPSRPPPVTDDSSARGDVSIPTGRAGIDEGGTMARFDGVMLPLRPPLIPIHPLMIDVLHAIDDRIKALLDLVP